MKTKHLTNQQKLNKLVKELNNANARYPIGVAILVERIQKIADLTRKDIEENGKNYDLGFGITNGMYLHFCNIVDETLKLND
jgi:hypothetical protein